jgi:hypothetical protein
VPVLAQRASSACASVRESVQSTTRAACGGVMKTGIDSASAIGTWIVLSRGAVASGTSRTIRR